MASVLVLVSLVCIAVIFLRRAALSSRARIVGDDKAPGSSFSDEATTPQSLGQRERPSLLFPPLAVAERGIDLDLENLFRIAGANSDSSYDADDEGHHSSRNGNGDMELPQARQLPSLRLGV